MFYWHAAATKYHIEWFKFRYLWHGNNHLLSNCIRPSVVQRPDKNISFAFGTNNLYFAANPFVTLTIPSSHNITNGRHIFFLAFLIFPPTSAYALILSSNWVNCLSVCCWFLIRLYQNHCGFMTRVISISDIFNNTSEVNNTTRSTHQDWVTFAYSFHSVDCESRLVLVVLRTFHIKERGRKITNTNWISKRNSP